MITGKSITILRPAHSQSRTGNGVTAERWLAILQSLGARVEIKTAYDGSPSDLLIAIHAWRSADGIAQFASAHSRKPIVVCLSGTDIYAFQASHPDATLASMQTATALVGLHDLVGRSIPEQFRSKLHIIYQSAPALVRRPPVQETFDVCVVGHLRAEKDPFRAAAAARLLPAHSKIRILHAGSAPDKHWTARALAENAENPRYHWLGGVDETAVRDVLTSCRLMVLSSTMEGGANVLSEAIAAGLPVLSSDIDGSVGLLGRDYPGYFNVGDTEQLARLLGRTESDAIFLAELTARCVALAPRFTVDRERRSWSQLLAVIGLVAGRAA